jgi:hypothetical protein
VKRLKELEHENNRLMRMYADLWLAHAKMRILLVPRAEGGVADGELPAEVSSRGPTLGLLDEIDDLLFGGS